MTSPTLPQIVEDLSEAQRADILSDKWYLASCDHCGWVGSSQECGTDHGPWGDSDVYCPVCDRSGADCGEIGNRFDDQVRTHLLSLGEGV